jgi:hypothetical protein
MPCSPAAHFHVSRQKTSVRYIDNMGKVEKIERKIKDSANPLLLRTDRRGCAASGVIAIGPPPSKRINVPGPRPGTLRN